MRVSVDQARCVASGNCVLTAPEVFDQRVEDGVVVLLDPSPPAELAESVRRAEALCPASVIRVDGLGRPGSDGRV
jgi:ferredoxin